MPHDVTVNTHCDVTIGRRCCLVDNHVPSQWLGDIVMDTNAYVTNGLDIVQKIQKILDLLQKIPVVGKRGYFTS